MKKSIIFTFIFLFSTFLFSQHKNKTYLYFNEDLKSISYDEFKKRKNSYLFYSKRKETDSTVIFQIQQNLKFGTLNKSEYKQLRLILFRDFNIDTTLNKTVVFQFVNTLYGYNQLKEKQKPYVLNFKNNDTIHISFSKTLYTKRRSVFDRYQKKCLKKADKNNILPLYLFKEKKGYDYTNKYVNWKNIPSTINTLFFNGKSGMVYINPKGEYFKFNEWYESQLKWLLKNNDWTKPIEDYNYLHKNLSNKPIGFFINTKVTKSYTSYSLPTPLTKESYKRAHIKNKLDNITVSCYMFPQY